VSGNGREAPIKVVCRSCGHAAKAPRALAGRRVRCPKCQEKVRVPAGLSGSDTSAFSLRQSSVDRPSPLRSKKPEKKPEPTRTPSEKKLRTPTAGSVKTPSKRDVRKLEPPAQKPGDADTTDPDTEPPPKKPATPSSKVVVRSPRNPAFSPRVWIAGVLVIPIVLSCFVHSRTTTEEQRQAWNDRIERTLKKLSPDDRVRIEGIMRSETATKDDLLEALPEKRLDGALLGHDTYAHWVFAIVTTALFLGAIPFAFKRGSEGRIELGSIAFYTATAGILILLGFQRLAAASLGMRGGGWILFVIRFIALSYELAEGHDDNILTSMLGFTCGVGLCEEVTKALPVIVHFVKGKTLTWRRACLWGFASGLGFGVAEGVMYSARSYNGVDTGGVYAVRFISCVGLHCLWAAAGSVSLAMDQVKIRTAPSLSVLGLCVVRALAAPIILHGFYDTLLKKESYVFALLCAIGTFAWFVSEIDRAYRAEMAGTAPKEATSADDAVTEA
jgi:RsiW-degrading membrane proteinase PrsW (M82 family)